MVALGAARMTVDPFEVARVELVEALARMVNRVIQHGKDEVQSVLGSIEEIRATVAEVANIDDFLEDLEAAERVLLLYLST
jgi:methyl-accepting chemotaxis protein